MKIRIIENYLTKNDCYNNGIFIKVKGLMIHSLGTPQPEAEGLMARWNKPNFSKCVNGFIEPNGTVYFTLPSMKQKGVAKKSWHCGGPGNSSYLGFEMTEPSTIKYTGGANYKDLDPEATRKHVLNTYAAAVQLFAKLCLFHGLNPLQDGVILSHHEGHLRGIASNHGDVEHLWNRQGLTMAQFRKDIYKEMHPVTPDYVKITATTLNVRKKPTTNSPVVTQLHLGDVVKVIGDNNGWYQISNGYISSTYAEPTNKPAPVEKAPVIIEEEDEDMTQERFNELMNNYLVTLAKMPPSDWSKEAREFCESKGLISGDSAGNKMYKKFTTREELAAIMNSFYKVIKSEEKD